MRPKNKIKINLDDPDTRATWNAVLDAKREVASWPAWKRGEGTNMPEKDKWDQRFIDLAKHVATWSKDPSTKTGAVIVDEQCRVRGLGYNGFPRGVWDLTERYNDRETKYKFVVHSEANAIMNAIGNVSGCMLYSTKFPCSECTKLIIQAGIVDVICEAGDPNDPSYQRWLEDSKISRTMLQEAGVLVRLV